MSGTVISGGRRTSRAAIFDNAAKVARGLENAGVGEGDFVALILRNDFPFFEVQMGAVMLGAYVVPVNWHFKGQEIGYILRDCKAKLVVIHADLLEAVEPSIPAECRIIVVPTPEEIALAYSVPATDRTYTGPGTPWDDWIASLPSWTDNPRPGRSGIFYTSGTTGSPKGVVRNAEDDESGKAIQSLTRLILGFEPGTSIRTVVTGPAYHAMPFTFAILSVHMADTVVLQPKFDPENLLQLIEEHGVTHLQLVPTMFKRLLDLPEDTRNRYDLSSLRFVAHSAAPCPAELKRRMIEWWGPVIFEYYGATEVGAVTFHNSHEALSKPGTVGRAIDGCTIRILDDEGRECDPGEVGEIYVVNPSLPDFTYNGLDDKRSEIEKAGLISVGDVGYLDADGYLFVTDRARDMVISGGVNIYPAEIEATLVAMPGVVDCAVFGIPHAEFGETICAHVTKASGAPLSETEIRDWLGERLARYKVPSRIVFDDNLPREDSGKIMKRKIRDRYWAAQERAI